MTSPDLGIPGISDATLVGQGSFGVVYRARQDAVGRSVAVKLLNVSGLDDQNGRRFENECRALGALSGHSNIVAVYDSGTSAQGRPYLVMDYLPGGTLAQRLERAGPLPWWVAAEIGVKLAGALGSAHEAGVLHRDVKPENVLFSAYDEPQLVDFGVARLGAGSQTGPAGITASLAHAAPEVLAGERATVASDVYSLASTLYALLAGHAPFARTSDETFHPMLTRMHAEDPPDLRAAGAPERMGQALGAALAKVPADRTADARAFAEALQDAQRSAGRDVTPLVPPATTAAAAPPPAPAPAGSPTVTLLQRPPAPSSDAPERSSRPWVTGLAITGATIVLIAAIALIAPALGGRSPDRTAVTTSTTARPAPQSTTTETPPAEPAAVPPSSRKSPAVPPAVPRSTSPAPPPPPPRSGPSADPPSKPPSSGTATARAACSDGRDNDTDGKEDFPRDPGCSSKRDDAEKDAAANTGAGTQPPDQPGTTHRTPCSDGLDNDHDAKTDYPADPGCTSPTDSAEKDAAVNTGAGKKPPNRPGTTHRTPCSDGLDNDHDAKTDYPADPGCTSPTGNAEKQPPCSDGIDNDHDAKIDYPADPGCTSPTGNAEKQPPCSDGIDNDHDAKIDYPADPGCTSAADGAEKT